MATALTPTPAVRSHAVWGPSLQRAISGAGVARQWPRPCTAWLRKQSPAQHTVIFLCLLDNLLSAHAEQDPAPKSQCSAGSRDGSSRDRGQRVWTAGLGLWGSGSSTMGCEDTRTVAERVKGGEHRAGGLPRPPSAGMGTGTGRDRDYPAHSHGAGAAQQPPRSQWPCSRCVTAAFLTR